MSKFREFEECLISEQRLCGSDPVRDFHRWDLSLVGRGYRITFPTCQGDLFCAGQGEREEDYGKCGMKDGDTLLFAFLMEVSSGQSFCVLHRFKYQKKLNQQ